MGAEQDPDNLSLVRISVARHAAENNAPVSKDSGYARHRGGPNTYSREGGQSWALHMLLVLPLRRFQWRPVGPSWISRRR